MGAARAAPHAHDQHLRDSAGAPIQPSKTHGAGHGHYDSINSNVFSGWAIPPAPRREPTTMPRGLRFRLECARALSKLRFPSTIVFAAVPGEEEGLVGSEHLADLAREQGWQLEAVLNNDIVGGNTTPGDKLQLKDRCASSQRACHHPRLPSRRAASSTGRRKRLAQPRACPRYCRRSPQLLSRSDFRHRSCRQTVCTHSRHFWCTGQIVMAVAAITARSTRKGLPRFALPSGARTRQAATAARP